MLRDNIKTLAMRTKYKFSKLRILSRTCCVGNRVSAKLQESFALNNQKYRLDYLWNDDRLSIKLHPKDMMLFADSQLLGLVKAQNNLHFFVPSLIPDIVIIDSFSDLTDRLFTTKIGSKFFCHFSDLSVETRAYLRDPSHTNQYIVDEGLMSLDGYSEKLDCLARRIWSIYGQSIPVFFINVPVVYETRDAYLRRAKQIFRESQLVAESCCNFFSISLDPGDVHSSPEDSFPYHFDDRTIDCFVREIKHA